MALVIDFKPPPQWQRESLLHEVEHRDLLWLRCSERRVLLDSNNHNLTLWCSSLWLIILHE